MTSRALISNLHCTLSANQKRVREFNVQVLFDKFRKRLNFFFLFRFHQVRSYGRNIAVNLWWKYTPGFVPRDCDGVEQDQTLDKVTFTSLDSDLEQSEITVL